MLTGNPVVTTWVRQADTGCTTRRDSILADPATVYTCTKSVMPKG